VRRHGDAHGGTSRNALAAVTLVGTLLAAVAVLVAPSASATDDATQSCIVHLSTDEVDCFANRTDAELAATGSLTSPSSALTGKASGSSLSVAAAATDVTLGRVFEHINYGGQVLIYMETTGCDSNPDIDHRRNVMPSGWNDRISSILGYSKCQLKLWEHGYLSGDSYGPDGAAMTIGAMNDRTSSISFH
jgi:hypothetical protein